MAKELRGYDISDENKRKIDEEIRKYYEYLEISEMPLDDEEYYSALSLSYDRIVTSATNNITKTTEMAAIRISEKRQEKDRASAIVSAIDRGIERAANTSVRLDLAEGIRNDLFENMVEKRSRDFFARHPRTITKYRRRAYYYIAEELGLVERR